MTRPLQEDTHAESLIEVVIYLMISIVVMTILYLTVGPLLDRFINFEESLEWMLGSWGLGMMDNVKTWAKWVFYIPAIFLSLVMAWGIKTIIKRKKYLTAQDVYMNPEDQI